MEEYTRNLATRIMGELDATKIPLLETAFKIEKEVNALDQIKKKGMPLVDPHTISIFLKPLAIAILAGVIVRSIFKIGEKIFERTQKSDVAKIFIAKKKEIFKESLQISVQLKMDRKSSENILKEAINFIEKHPETLFP